MHAGWRRRRTGAQSEGPFLQRGDHRAAARGRKEQQQAAAEEGTYKSIWWYCAVMRNLPQVNGPSKGALSVWSNYGQGPGLVGRLQQLDFVVKMLVATYGACNADCLSAPLTEAAVVARCLRLVVKAVGRDQDISSWRAEGAAIDHVDHNVMQFWRRLR